MSALLKHFDRIALISLPDRGDRRKRLLANLAEHGLASPADITRIDAVDGRIERLPGWWKSGPGAWGCRFSQLRAIESARRDGLRNVLILEDDAVFHPRTAEWLDATVPLLPPGWGQFFLGGEHLRPVSPTRHPKLVKANYVTRTHAYAVNAPVFDFLITRIRDDGEYKKRPGWHVDHQYGLCQLTGLLDAYAPSWWMAAQEEGFSDIAAESFGRRWWQDGLHYWKLPFIRVPSALAVPDSPWLHQPDKPAPENAGKIPFWLRDIAREAWERGKLPSCAPATLDAGTLAKFWPGGVREARSAREVKHLADYPANGLFPHPFTHT